MSVAAEGGHAAPNWFTPPGEGDIYAMIAVVVLAGAIYGIIVIYAAFDRWAEHQSHGTPLAKTIPTMLAIALLYEIFPLGHFNILLPIAAILIALMADWSRFHLNASGQAEDAETAPDTSEIDTATDGAAEKEQTSNV